MPVQQKQRSNMATLFVGTVSILIAFFVATVVCSSTKPVVLLTIDNFVDETKETDILVQFYAPWAERTDGKTWEAVASSVHASGAGKVPAFPLPCGLLLSPRALVRTCATIVRCDASQHLY